MKKIILLLVLTAGITHFTTAQNTEKAASLAIGSELPKTDKILRSATLGEAKTIDKYKTDKGLLVMFTCNTCPYVIKSQKRTLELMDMAAKNGIGVVALNSNEAQRDEADSYESMKKYAKDQGYKFPYLLDKNSGIADIFGATRTPEVYLFNAKGILVYKGAMEDNPSEPQNSKEVYLRTAIKNMLAGVAIEPNETKSIGCTIKRVK